MEDAPDIDQQIADAQSEWHRLAPSYIHGDVKLLDGNLRDWFERGMTVAMFREALEIAFAQPGVEKRKALAYAFGVVRRRLNQT